MDGGRPPACQPRDHVPGAGPLGTHVKKKTLIAAEQDAEARTQWRAEMVTIAPETLVFLDETSTQTVMTRSRGRAPKGERIIGQVPRNHGHNITCLAAISATGIIAPCVFERSLDGPLFVQWVTDWLLPTLPKGTTIVLDNLSVHRTPDARAAVEQAGCSLLFLPAYSPDFNPIELVFAHLKTHLRGMAARTHEAVVAAIATGLDKVTTAHLHAYYRHCGYPLPGQSL